MKTFFLKVFIEDVIEKTVRTVTLESNWSHSRYNLNSQMWHKNKVEVSRIEIKDLLYKEKLADKAATQLQWKNQTKHE